jgi:hypothetical protein
MRVKEEREQVLKEWTKARLVWLDERRLLRRRIRDLERLLFGYLNGDS